MTELASTEVEIRPDRGPGNPFHNLYVTITSNAEGRFAIKACEVWGDNQGNYEVHGRLNVVGRGSCLDEAVEDCFALAEKRKLDSAALAEALSMAAYEAESELLSLSRTEDIVDG